MKSSNSAVDDDPEMAEAASPSSHSGAKQWSYTVVIYAEIVASSKYIKKSGVDACQEVI